MKNETSPSIQLPPGCPGWITSELIENTIHVWQPYYPNRLQPADAMEMILNAGHLMLSIKEISCEKICRTGSG